MKDFRILQLNGGVVTPGEPANFYLPQGVEGYADAQIDDYGQGAGFYRKRGVSMQLNARFSHASGILQGTAGFGFWNAPFADPTVRRLALPQAVWFFYASPPSDLPLRVHGPGQGWFASTIDAGARTAVSLIPLAPVYLLFSRSRRFRLHVWPMVRRRLGISFQPLPTPLTEWHSYRLEWLAAGCRFYVDGELVLATPFSPRGPLGFVCWLDNQTMTLTANGRFHWGTLPVPEAQWLEVADLSLSQM